MKMKYYIRLVMMMIFLLFYLTGCSKGSNAKGQVEDKFTGVSLPDVSITATTKTDIEEDKKYERITAKTNADGFFHLKGLSPKYSYSIEAKKANYTNDTTYLRPPEEGKTKLLNKSLKMIKKIPLKGKILDGKRKPIEGVKVNSAITDENGDFELPFVIGRLVLNVYAKQYPVWCNSKNISVTLDNYNKYLLDNINLSCTDLGNNKFQTFDGRYIDNGDETITDTETRLMWYRIPKRIKYGNAVEYCKKLSLANLKNWRLPSLNELKKVSNTEFQSILKQGKGYYMSTDFNVITYAGGNKMKYVKGISLDKEYNKKVCK